MDNKLNKVLKALFAAELVLILLIIALFSAENKEIPTAFAVKEDSNLKNNFKLFTKAVCKETQENQTFSGHRKPEGFSSESERIFCRDELFAVCNGEEYLIKGHNLSNYACNGINLNLSGLIVNGTAAFKKEWVDARE